MLNQIFLSVLSMFSFLSFSIENIQKGTPINQVQEKEQSVSVLFLGDMMFDRSVRVKAKSIGYESIFGPATTTIQNHDLTIANLEGPITSFKSKLVNNSGRAVSGFQFTFDEKVAPALKNVGIDLVSLANNHTDNFGQAGLDQTRKNLSENNVMYFGSPKNNPDLTATTTCVNNICIGIIGWHEFGYANDEYIVEKIKEIRATVDYLVIYPHWGTEYALTPNKKQVRLAHEWIDAGVDVVIGHHPHVIQSVEVYKDKYIFYSLGNFIFDQYFSFNTTHGIGVSAEVYKDRVEYKIIPFANVGHKVSELGEVSKGKIYDLLRTYSGRWIEEIIK